MIRWLRYIFGTRAQNAPAIENCLSAPHTRTLPQTSDLKPHDIELPPERPSVELPDAAKPTGAYLRIDVPAVVSIAPPGTTQTTTAATNLDEPILSPGERLRQSIIASKDRPLRPMPTLPSPLREVIVDIETTGLSPRVGHRIISISLIEVLNTEKIGSHLNFLLNPDRAIPKEATAIHGISNADVSRRTIPRFVDVANDIRAFIGESRIVGYNVQFDLNFLAAEFATFGDIPPMIRQASIDVMTLFQRARLGPRRRLRAACEEIGLDITALKAHSAYDDAAATARLYIALRSNYGPLHWDLLIKGSQVSIGSLQDVDRYYNDDDLQAAWKLFEAKDYDAALAQALDVVARGRGDEISESEALAYELACMVLRRRTQLKEEQNLLWRYFRRHLGPEVTAEQIILLSVPPWEGGISQVTKAADEGIDISRPNRVQRRRPATWEMAARFARVSQRIEEIPMTNQIRLDDALKALPSEHAFTEAAVCIRKIITERARGRYDISTELLRLHVLAQQHAFLYSTYRLGWDHPENKADARAGLYPHVVAEISSIKDLETIVLPYEKVGYLRLPLLNKTDIKRLVAVFGDPPGHTSPRESHITLWERYRRAARKSSARWREL